MSEQGIPEGRYKGHATGTVAFDKSDGGTECALVPLTFTEEGWEGRGVTLIGYLSEKAAPITIRQLRDMGWAGDSLTDTTGLGSVEVSITVRYEEYEGKSRMKVAVWPLGGGGVEARNPLSKGEISALDKRLRGLIVGSKRATPGAAAPAPFKPPPARQAPAQPRQPAPAKEWDGTGPDPSGGLDDLPY